MEHLLGPNARGARERPLGRERKLRAGVSSATRADALLKSPSPLAPRREHGEEAQSEPDRALLFPLFPPA